MVACSSARVLRRVSSMAVVIGRQRARKRTAEREPGQRGALTRARNQQHCRQHQQGRHGRELGLQAQPGHQPDARAAQCCRH